MYVTSDTDFGLDLICWCSVSKYSLSALFIICFSHKFTWIKIGFRLKLGLCVKSKLAWQNLSDTLLWGLFQDGDAGDNFEEALHDVEVFSRRKLESNWDRYEESERQGPDDDVPNQRGTDYHVLLESAGRSLSFPKGNYWRICIYNV